MLVLLTTTGSVAALEDRRAGRLGGRHNLVVLAVAAGEEQGCDHDEKGTRHHLPGTVARRQATTGTDAGDPDGDGATGAIASCSGATEHRARRRRPERNARTRRRSIALRLDGKGWLRVEARGAARAGHRRR